MRAGGWPKLLPQPLRHVRGDSAQDLGDELSERSRGDAFGGGGGAGPPNLLGAMAPFSWSASGQIFSESLASAFPTVLAYVVDTPRCASSPNTFMSNMLYACSMMYRTRLPLVIVFNKTDVVSAEFAEEWMTDYEAFQDALDEFQSSSSDSAASGYYASLTRSLSLVLDEFYGNLHHCGVSAATGEGVEGFMKIRYAKKDENTLTVSLEGLSPQPIVYSLVKVKTATEASRNAPETPSNPKRP